MTPNFLGGPNCGPERSDSFLGDRLGMEVGLSAGAFIIHGDPAPSPNKGAAPSPIFGPFLLWPNDWMHQDAT